MVELQPSKLATPVQSRSPAPSALAASATSGRGAKLIRLRPRKGSLNPINRSVRCGVGEGNLGAALSCACDSSRTRPRTWRSPRGRSPNCNSESHMRHQKTYRSGDQTPEQSDRSLRSQRRDGFSGTRPRSESLHLGCDACGRQRCRCSAVCFSGNAPACRSPYSLDSNYRIALWIFAATRTRSAA